MIAYICSARLFSLLSHILLVRATLTNNGCGRPLPTLLEPGGVANFSINSSASTQPPSEREYHVYIPLNYKIDIPTPLIFSFHGRSQNMMEQEYQSGLSRDHFNPGSILVYPQGTPNHEGKLEWSGDPDTPKTTNDTLFVTELLNHFEANYCVDTSRIYALGISNGGGLTNRLACNPSLSTRIAAFAAIAAAIYPAQDEPCLPGRASIPLLEFHGGSDEQIHYHGGLNHGERGYTIDIPTFLQHWARRNGCAKDAANTTGELFDAEGFNYANRTTWDCAGAKEIVTHYYSSFLGHTWPWWFNAGYNATEVIMEFFRGHRLPLSEGEEWEMGHESELK